MEQATHSLSESLDCSENFLHSEIKIEAEELEEEWWLREPAVPPDVSAPEQSPAPPLVIKQERREPPPLIPFTRHLPLPPLVPRECGAIIPHGCLPCDEDVKPNVCRPCSVRLDRSEVTRYFSKTTPKSTPKALTLEGLLSKSLASTSEIPPLRLVMSYRALRYKSSIQCKTCNKVCRNKISYLNHIQMHCGKKVYYCKFCSSYYYRAQSVYRHTKLCHGEYPSCTGCREAFRTEYELKHHKLTCECYIVFENTNPRVEYMLYQCSQCNFTSTIKDNLESHIIWKHNKNTHEDLMVRFNIIETLKLNYELRNDNHQLYSELSSNYLIHCLTCNEDFSYDNYFCTHFEQCFQKDNFMCPFCCALKPRFLRENVAEHINKHIKATDKVDRCNTCNSSFFSRINLTMHRRKMHCTVQEQEIYPEPSYPEPRRPPQVKIVNIDSILMRKDD